MTKKEVLMIGNPALRRIAEIVKDFEGIEFENTITDLKDTLIHLKNTKNIGRALAAPQIGFSVRIVYVNSTEREFYLVNPDIIWRSKESFEVWDSCFSFDVSFFVKVERNREIRVRYQTERGEVMEEAFLGEEAELLQHEIDHLDGILATDRMTAKRDIIMRSEWEKIVK